MRIDMTNVDSAQAVYEPIPAGKYIVEVTDYTERVASEKAKNPGAPTVSFELTVQSTIGGETEIEDKTTGKAVKVEGRKIYENMTLVENSFWRLKAFLEASGFDVEGEIDFDPAEVIGTQLVAKVGIQKGRKNPETGEEYDPRNSVKAFEAVE